MSKAIIKNSTVSQLYLATEYYSYICQSKFFLYAPKMDEYPYLTDAVAKTLQHWREERQLSKRKLSELARLERVYLIQLEKGQKKPTLNAVFCLCEALGIRPSDFIRQIEDEIKRTK